MIMLKRLFRSSVFALGALLTLALSSCDSAYRTNYLQDIETAKAYGVKYNSEIVVQKGDKLRILVSSLRNPELTLPFSNRTAGVAVPSALQGNKVAAADTTSSYLVDAQGNIQFPILGNLPVQGLSLDQVSELIQSRLIAGKYLADAHVTTKFDNLRVYLLGAFEGIVTSSASSQGVADRGSFHLDNPQTNILELIARTGGLSERADFSKVNVIRRVGNEYVYYRLDMLSKNIFDSPAFYLQQNDIIYAEYRYRTRDTEQKILSTVGYVTTAMSTIVSAVALVTLLKR